VATANRIYRVKLVSDAVPDMTSLEALVADLVKPGMSHQERCETLRRVIWEHRFNGPDTYATDRASHDPVFCLNTHAGTICSQDATILCALWAAVGYDTRVHELGWHTTAEVFYDGSWHNFDPTLWERDKASVVIRRRGKRVIAGVQDRTDDWLHEGGQPHRWDDYGIGHRMDLCLRRGETFTRYWAPLGTTPDYWRPGTGGGPPGDTRDRMKWVLQACRPPFAPPPRTHTYANGEWDFTPDLSAAAYRQYAEETRNVHAVSDGLSSRRVARPATIVFRMDSPYIITGGWLTARLHRRTARDTITMSLSTDEGVTWQRAWRPHRTGTLKTRLSVRRFVAGHHTFLIRIELRSHTQPSDVILESLNLRTLVQLNPFSLLALKKGLNTLRFDAGDQVASRVIYPDLAGPSFRDGVFRADNVVAKAPPEVPYWAAGLHARNPARSSELVYRLTCPGDIVHVEWGGQFVTQLNPRHRDGRRPRADNAMAYSLDGRTWHDLKWTYRYAQKQPHGEKLMQVHIESLPRLPKGTRTVQLRYRFRRSGHPDPDEIDSLLMPWLRIRADYRPPVAGTLPPVETTYCWEDKSGEQRHRQRITRRREEYSIDVKRDPTMKWIRMRVPDENRCQMSVSPDSDRV